MPPFIMSTTYTYIIAWVSADNTEVETHQLTGTWYDVISYIHHKIKHLPDDIFHEEEVKTYLLEHEIMLAVHQLTS